MTKKESFLAAITVLASSYNRELVPSAVEGYWISLQDLSEDQLKTALTRALREWEGKFMPTAPELRRLALGVPSDNQRKLRAAESWEIVRMAMDKYDYGQTVDFGAVSNSVIRNMGGWAWLCDRTKDNLTFDRIKFEELHQQYAGTEIPASRTLPLIGAHYQNVIRFQVPGEPAQVRRPALPEKESPVLALVRDLAEKKSAG